MPQAAFGDFKLLIGNVKVGLDALIFVTNRLNLSTDFDNLVGQGARVLAQLSIGRCNSACFCSSSRSAANRARRSSASLLARLMPVLRHAGMYHRHHPTSS